MLSVRLKSCFITGSIFIFSFFSSSEISFLSLIERVGTNTLFNLLKIVGNNFESLFVVKINTVLSFGSSRDFNSLFCAVSFITSALKMIKTRVLDCTGLVEIKFTIFEISSTLMLSCSIIVKSG